MDPFTEAMDELECAISHASMVWLMDSNKLRGADLNRIQEAFDRMKTARENENTSWETEI